MVSSARQSISLQYPIMTRYSIGGKSQIWRQSSTKQLNYDKITGSLWRFDIYTHPFITGIVNERFDMCLVGNIRLKSRSMEGKHDVMKNESSELELWLFKVPWLLSNH